MIVIGITGGIGTGKTEVTGILAGLGAAVIDADALGHEVYRKGSEGYGAVVGSFGPGVVGADGEIDRTALGELVFADPDLLSRLNSLMHPRIRRAALTRLKSLREAGTRVAALEAAVLLEAGWDDMVDEVWVVAAPWETVTSRLVSRFDGDDEAMAARARAQMSDEDRLRAADVTISNGGSLSCLRRQVERAYRERMQLAQETASNT